MTEPQREPDEGMGGRFWFALIGLGLAVVVAGLVVFVLFGRVWYSYGFFATFLLLALVLIVVAWIYDRREAQRRSRYTSS